MSALGGTALAEAFRATAAPKPAKRRRKREAPFSLRLSADERARLAREAGETPLATYIKLRLFNNLGPLASYGPALPGAARGTDTQLIAKLLAALGDARLANNLNQLAKAANMGTLDVSKATENELLSACAEVHAMRRDLIAALGLKS
jgi:mobilization protein MobC